MIVKKIREQTEVLIQRHRERLEKEIAAYERKLRDTMSYYGCGGPYRRQEEAIEKREAQLDKLNDFEKQLYRMKEHEKVSMWVFTCRNCGSVTMVSRQPFDDWHECPVCRGMIHLDHLPSTSFEIVNEKKGWQQILKEATEGQK